MGETIPLRLDSGGRIPLPVRCIRHGPPAVSRVYSWSMRRILLFGFGLFFLAIDAEELLAHLLWIGGIMVARFGHTQMPDRQNHAAELRAPVADVVLLDDAVALEIEHAHQSISDDRRAEVADVEFLGDVGAAVIDDDGLGGFGVLYAER